MEDNSVVKNKSRLKIYYSLLITIICIIGVSFAWFKLYLSQKEDNTMASRTCFSTTLTEETSKIALTDEFPVVDEKGLKKAPFTFTVKNNCSGYVKMYITIDSVYRTSTDSSYLSDDYIKVNLSSKGTTDNDSVILGEQSLTDLDNNSKGYILINTGLRANEEKSYDLRIWMDEYVTAEEGLNKAWAGKIVIITSAANETFADTILLDNSVRQPITSPGSEVSAYTLDDVENNTAGGYYIRSSYYITYGTGYEAFDTKFDLTGTAVTSDTYANSYSELVGKYLPSKNLANAGSSYEGQMQNTTNLDTIYYVVSATEDSFVYKEITSNKNTTEALLASTEDDYGTSYYFRGAVKNNYVQFANKCWRTVRITGNGSVKLVLHNDNIDNVSNPCSSANNSEDAAFAHFNGTDYQGYVGEYNTNDDNAYIGFMYGTTGASTYAEAHANTNKSIILTNLETWYKNNLSSYTDKLADVIWCNDKNVDTSTDFDPYSIGIGTNFGYGKNGNYFSSTRRLVFSSVLAGGDGPSLICSNDNNGGKLSKFTVDDTTYGNGALTYKIGLLTADEIAYAGLVYRRSNYTTYLSENVGTTYWWTMTPSHCDGYNVNMWTVCPGDMINNYSNSIIGVRPSIALDTSTKVSGGTGISEDPYIVN